MQKSLLLFLLGFLFFMNDLIAQVSSNPTPIVATSSATLIFTSTAAGPFYVYSWAKAGSVDKAAVAWADNINDTYKMTKESNGTFTFTISSIKSFYKLTDAELATVTQIGLLVRKSDGNKETPNDLFLSVTQAPPPPPYSGGDGSLSTPYLISTSADLVKLSKTSADWSKNFKVTAPLVATNITSPIGNSSLQFTGTFDGGNFNISGTTLSGANDVAFFGVINGASISKVSLRNIVITSTGNNVGGLVGVSNGSSVITASSVQGSVTSEGGAVGGFIGLLNSGNISTSYSAVSVSSNYGSCVGGFVGLQAGNTAIVADCYSTGEVTGITSTAIGGFVGKLANSASISTSYATGNVTSGNEFVGGFVGASYGIIQNCFATPQTIAATGNYVAPFGGNNNGENQSSGNIVWNGSTCSSGTFTGFGEQGVLKSAIAFNSQSSFNGVGGLNFTFSSAKWRWDTNSYPALVTLTEQIYPYPFSVGTSIYNNESNADILIYPTIVTSTLTVLGDNLSQVMVVSVAGVVVINEMNLNPTQSTCSISVADLASGIYVVKVFCIDGAIASMKIIKK